MAVKPDGKQSLVTSSTPAKVGDVLVIYCAGLGPVTPAVVAGTATPLSPLSGTVDPVSVTIGGQSATVLFAGLTPSLAGLYQVNVKLPSGLAPGPSVPVVVSVGGTSSSLVTIAVSQ